MPDLGPLVDALTPVLGPALKALLRSLATMVVLALVVAGVSFHHAAEGSLLRGVLAAAAALMFCGILGGIVSIKRAVLTALRDGLVRLGLGRRALTVLFERVLAVSGDDDHGARGIGLARLAERVPLASAEKRVSAAVTSLVAAPGEGGGATGFLRRSLQERLLAYVADLTLARFREPGADVGGVDLVLVRDDLAQRVDETLARQLDGMLLKVTAVFVLAAVVGSLVVSEAVRRLPL